SAAKKCLSVLFSTAGTRLSKRVGSTLMYCADTPQVHASSAQIVQKSTNTVTAETATSRPS
ncbi:unnamed protein product, partial [Tenebrio molitor]